MRQPMGIIVSGGIIASTFMTLWLIPALEFVLKGSRSHGIQKSSKIKEVAQ
jgi:Cu/Ag efflux pump CusA